SDEGRSELRRGALVLWASCGRTPSPPLLGGGTGTPGTRRLQRQRPVISALSELGAPGALIRGQRALGIHLPGKARGESRASGGGGSGAIFAGNPPDVGGQPRDLACVGRVRLGHSGTFPVSPTERQD